MSELRKAIRQFAFDIIVTECGMDEDDHDDQMEASERVDAWMKHWDSHEHFAAARRWDALDSDWPIVRKLVEAQIAKLESHRHDRGLDGWMNEEPHWLLRRLREEVEELVANPSWEEAADVANFAAMFADVAARAVKEAGR